MSFSWLHPTSPTASCCFFAAFQVTSHTESCRQHIYTPYVKLRCSTNTICVHVFFFFQAEDGIRYSSVTGVQTCALPIYLLGRILRCNQRFSQLLRREPKSLVGRSVTELLSVKDAAYKSCPYCEGVAGEGDEPDPWLARYFLASNSTFTDPSGHQLATVHVLQDITDRKRAEEKDRSLHASVLEGDFNSEP